MVGKFIGGVVLIGALAGFAPGVMVGQASAQISSQVTDSELTHMVVTNQQAMVRCGAGMAYYPVSELRINAILIMDGETASGWTRVKYPTTAAAFVRIEYADVSADGNVLTLSRDDSLIAYNALAGAKGSWSKLIAEPLPRGTQLQITGEATNKQSGELEGYQVVAPDEARGYVRTKFLRPATTAEIQAWQQAVLDGDAAADESESLADELPGLDPGTDAIPQADPGMGDANEEVTDAAEQESADPIIMDPMIDDNDVASPVTTDETQTQTEPTDAETADVDPAADTGEQVADEPEPVIPAPPPLRINSIEELEQLFEAVQKQTAEEAEYGPLLAEVTRMYEETADSAENAGLRTALRQRQSVLKIRQRVQEAARSNHEAVDQANERQIALAARIHELEIKRSYAVVGRLLPSAVYDGKRLPRMYRVQSIDGTEAPRTLGYLRPDETINLESMLGETIGVIGTPNLDPRLNLRIITPIKVDLIHSVEGE